MASPRATRWSLTEHLLSTQEHLYKSATQHPFLLAGAEGRLPKEVLSRWLANDRLYIHSYIRAAGKLLASIDLPKQVPGSQEAFETQLADWLIEALAAIRKEERFFIDVADRYGLGIELVLPFPPSPASQATAATATTTTSDPSHSAAASKLPGLTQIESIFDSIVSSPSPNQGNSPSKVRGIALVQSLFTTTATTTTAATAPPPLLPWLEGALTFWGTERCYLDAWSWARDKAEERGHDGAAKEDADGGALRREFIPNWSSPEFAQFVQRLGRLIDEAVWEAVKEKEGEEGERVRGEILGRVERPWKTLLEAEGGFWPDV